LILYILFCCLHCDCLGLAAIKWFLTAFETLNLRTTFALATRHRAQGLSKENEQSISTRRGLW